MDGMRALAALAVVASHVRNILFVDATDKLSLLWRCFYFLTGFGHQAVMIFFVLSGYWIAKTVVRRFSAERSFNWADYLLDRLSRLWIVLLPALVLGGALDAVGRYVLVAPLYLGSQGTNTITYDVSTHLSGAYLAANIFFLQTLVLEPFGSNGPLWSLANEFWYYLWFPAVLSLLLRRRLSVALFLFAAITMVAFRSLLPGFMCWLTGACVFYTSEKLRPFSCASSTAWHIALLTTSALVLSALTASRLPNLTLGVNYQDVSISVAFALFIFVLIARAGTYPRWLRPFCRYGANSSYSLYVLHFPLVVFLSALFLSPVERLRPSGVLVWAAATLIFVTIAYSYAMSRFTEANTSSLRRWLRETLGVAPLTSPIDPQVPVHNDDL